MGCITHHTITEIISMEYSPASGNAPYYFLVWYRRAEYTAFLLKISNGYAGGRPCVKSECRGDDTFPAGNGDRLIYGHVIETVINPVGDQPPPRVHIIFWVPHIFKQIA